MKIITFVLAFGLSLLMTLSAASNAEKTDKSKENTKAAKTSPQKTDAKAAAENTASVDNPFKESQDEIKACKTKLEAAKKSNSKSQEKSALKALQSAQRKLKFQYEKKTKPLTVSLSEKNNSLKNSRDPKKKAELQADIKKIQSELQAIEKVADMKNMCAVPAEEIEKNKDVTAGKNKKSKKTRKSKKKK